MSRGRGVTRTWRRAGGSLKTLIMRQQTAAHGSTRQHTAVHDSAPQRTAENNPSGPKWATAGMVDRGVKEGSDGA